MRPHYPLIILGIICFQCTLNIIINLLQQAINPDPKAPHFLLQAGLQFINNPTHALAPPSFYILTTWTNSRTLRIHWFDKEMNPHLEKMMTTQAAGKSEATRQLKEIRQINTKNHQKLRQQQEEEDKQKKDKAEATQCWEEHEKAAKPAKFQPPIEDPIIAYFSKNMRDIMDGVQDMETDDRNQEKENVRSPVKKCSGSSKTTSWRKGNHFVSPTKQESIPQAASWVTSFLDTFIYFHS
jgi:hypothetical protein